MKQKPDNVQSSPQEVAWTSETVLKTVYPLFREYDVRGRWRTSDAGLPCVATRRARTLDFSPFNDFISGIGISQEEEVFAAERINIHTEMETITLEVETSANNYILLCFEMCIFFKAGIKDQVFLRFRLVEKRPSFTERRALTKSEVLF